MTGANCSCVPAGKPQLVTFVAAVPYCWSVEVESKKAVAEQPPIEAVNETLVGIDASIAGAEPELRHPVDTRMPVVLTTTEAFNPGLEGKLNCAVAHPLPTKGGSGSCSNACASVN